MPIHLRAEPGDYADGLMRAGLGSSAELGILPLGTGRDFARSLRIPRRPGAAIDVARGGRVRTIDVGRATYTTVEGEASGFFANFGGAGISGAIARRANETTKALGGRLSF